MFFGVFKKHHINFLKAGQGKKISFSTSFMSRIRSFVIWFLLKFIYTFMIVFQSRDS
jgi:hypothetical protein